MKQVAFVTFLVILLSVALAACAVDALTLAQRGVSSNAEWAPVIQEFEGVEMVLVPVGCFMMGSEVSTGAGDSSPVHEQCFEQPFWIDRTEVTNAAFGSEGAYSGDNLPRDSVTWFEAQSHCDTRGARLPTEAEWEYAARGPDNWAYPWGDSFVPGNTVYSQNSADQTAEVASRPDGVSWVGAFDLAGNLREWTNSINESYPYDPLDGRESLPSGEEVIQRSRIIRGGSWDSLESDIFLTNRNPTTPGYIHDFIGFRCALDFAGP